MSDPRAIAIGNWLSDFLNGFEAEGFKKSRDHTIKGERDLLKILKFFFLAKFPRVQPESLAPKRKQIDFRFGNTALEIAVRNKEGSGQLIVGANTSEMKKLRTHSGLSVLALINMEPHPTLSVAKTIKDYRGHSLGKGNYKRFPVTILYIHRTDGAYDFQKYVVKA